MIQKYNRGSVWWYDFGSLNVEESITLKRRPVVIVSNDLNNLHSDVVVIAPITTHKKQDCRPWQVYFYNDRDQIIQCEQLRAVNKRCLANYEGQLDEIVMREVDKALAIQLDIPINERDKEATDYLERFDKSLTSILDSKLKVRNDVSISYLNNILDEQKIIKKYLSEYMDKVADKISVKQTDEIMNKLSEIENIRKNHDAQLCQILTNLSKLMVKVMDGVKDESETVQIAPESAQIEKKKTVKENISQVQIKPNKQENEPKTKTEKKSEKKTMTQIEKFNAKWSKPVIPVTYKKDKDDSEPKVNKGGGGISHHRSPYKAQRDATNYDNITECLAFLEECRTLSMIELCGKYKLSEKQISNKKYLICCRLKEKGIDYPNVRIRRT